MTSDMEGPTTGWRLRQIFNRNVKQERAEQEQETTLRKPTDEEIFDFNVIDKEKPTEYAQLEIFHRAVYPSELECCIKY